MLKALDDRRSAERRFGSVLRQPITILAAISVVYTVVQLVVVAPGLALGWDETVYASQVSGHAPPAMWTAPRARGITYLIAPVAFTLPDVQVLRIYLAVLSGLALFGSYALWLRVRRTLAVPLAAGLFAAFWTALYYGPMVMPNLWVAFGAVAATALTVLAWRRPFRPLPAVGLALVIAAVALIRPSDSFLLVAALGLAVCFRLFRSGGKALLVPLAALAVGEIVGMTQWIVESYQSFGGPLRRLRDASAFQGSEPGDHVVNALRALHGPLFCNQECRAQVSAVDLAFWTALVLGAVLGLVVAYWKRRLRIAVFQVGTAVLLALTYLFLVPLAAPRFLLPAYALLVLPIADGLVALPQAIPHRARVVTAALAAAVACFVAGEQAVLIHLRGDNQRSQSVLQAATETLRDAGIRPPCLIAGNGSVQIAFQLGCNSRSPSLPRSKGTPPYIREALPVKSVGVVASQQPPKGTYVERWVELPVASTAWRAYVPAGQRAD